MNTFKRYMPKNSMLFVIVYKVSYFVSLGSAYCTKLCLISLKIVRSAESDYGFKSQLHRAPVSSVQPSELQVRHIELVSISV